ncbi:MAG: ATP-binding protein [bacterium]
MLVEMNLNKALEALEGPEIIFEKTVVPREEPAPGHCPYLPEYDWMFLFERNLARKLDKWLEEHRRELVGASGLLSEALSNAYCHGNRRDPAKPIHISVLKSHKGLLVRIKDAGAGFNFPETFHKLQKGGNYYKLAGNGIKRMISSEVFAVFYTEGGRSFNLLYLFEGLRSLLPRSLSKPDESPAG